MVELAKKLGNALEEVERRKWKPPVYKHGEPYVKEPSPDDPQVFFADNEGSEGYYCPCAKSCHENQHPCGFSCVAHHQQVLDEGSEG